MPGLQSYTTRFGSLDDYQKGEIDIIDDDPTRYAFSNMFEVSAGMRSRGFEGARLNLRQERAILLMHQEVDRYLRKA